ncbi:MAG: hypothetical protein ACI3YM_06955 [Prevotella sp.]
MAQLSKLLLIGGLLASPLSSVSAKQYVLLSTPVEHQIMNISPNGKWACGVYVDFNQAAFGFRWNLESGTVELLSTANSSSAWSVANDGTVAGTFCTDELNGRMTEVPGYYDNQGWHTVEMPGGQVNYGAGTGITPDGKAMTGYVIVNGIYRSYVWREGKIDWTVDFNDHTLSYAIAPDGKAMTGWSFEYNRTAYCWHDDGTKTLLSDVKSPWSSGRYFSSDGKKLLFWGGWDDSIKDHNWLRCLYDREKGEYTYVPTVYPESGLDLFNMSDNGILVGTEADDTYAFVHDNGSSYLAIPYLQQKGVDFSNSHFSYFENDTLPVVFRAQGISADGKAIGLIYYDDEGYMKSMVVKLDQNLTYTPPTEVKAEVLDRLNVVRITWKPMAGAEPVKGYNIYRDGVKVNNQPVSGLSYYDEGLAEGNYQYQVAAVAADDTETKAEAVGIQLTGVEPQMPNYLYARQMGINSAKLIWEAPNSNHIVLGYTPDHTPNLQGFGITADDIEFEAAVYVDSADMCYYGKNARLTEVSFYPMSEQKSWSVAIYTHAADGSLQLLRLQQVTQPLVYKQRNTVVLDEPLALPASDLIIAIRVKVDRASQSVLGMDYGVDGTGYADMARNLADAGDFYSICQSSNTQAYSYFTSFLINAVVVPEGADQAKDVVKGYVVSCNGKEMETLSADSRSYDFRSLPDGYYDLGVKAVYEDGSQSDVATANLNVKGSYPRISKIEMISNEGDQATFAWKAPTDNDETLFTYNSGMPSTNASNGVKGPADYNYGLVAGVRYPAKMFRAYDGYKVKKFRFYPTSDAVFTFMLYENDKQVAEIEVDDYQLNQWNEVVLDEPILINPSADYLLALDCYDVTPGEAALAVDKSYCEQGVSDLYTLDGESWSSIIDASVSGSWLLDMQLAKPTEQLADVTGYNVRIDRKLVTPEPIAETQYTHTFDADASGTHMVSVAIVYPSLDRELTGFSKSFTITTTAIEAATAETIQVKSGAEWLRVEGGAVKSLSLYATDGRLMTAAQGNELPLRGLQGGIYLVVIKQEGGKEITRKIEIRR